MARVTALGNLFTRVRLVALITFYYRPLLDPRLPGATSTPQ